MAGSRAVGDCEPGQVRKEAALSGSAHAPRTNLAGADERRARPRTAFDDRGARSTFQNLASTSALRRWNSSSVIAPERRWAAMESLLSGPTLPRDLVVP